MHQIHQLAFVVLAALIWGHAPFALAQSEQYPLAPPDLSSPRATLTNFIAGMNAVHQRWKTEGRSYQNRAQLAAAARLAPMFFDLGDVAPSIRTNVGRETAVFIKETLDRVGLPRWEEIPDQAMIAAKPGGLNQWTIPHTEITLIRVKEGLREGQWVFSSETHKRAAEFYERVKHLPYLPGSTEGLYDLFVSEPGWLIPKSFIRALPGWMKARWGDQVVWQWCALVLTLVVTAALMVLIYRVGQRWSRRQRGASYYLAAVFPLVAVILPQLATSFLANHVFITGQLLATIDFALDLVSLAALVVFIMWVTNRLANALMALPWFKPGQLNAQLAQLIVRALGVAAAVVAVFEGGRYVGVPVATLIAGISVSGLTVALAAQDTLKNLFGSLMILLDRPFQVGDTIRVKGHEGKVESVGLRSTRIRDSSGHVVSIPNDEMARLDSKKMSHQSHLHRKEVLRLRADTPPAQVRSFVAFVSGMLENHEGYDPAHPPSVRIGLGDDAVIVTISYSYHPPNAAAFAAFNEKVALQILEGMAKEGVQLAQAGNASPARG
jgi:MscS family membrane protein